MRLDGGRVDILWSADDDRVMIDWIEEGGPPVADQPETTGFGTWLSQSTVVGQFGGEISRSGGATVWRCG